MTRQPQRQFDLLPFPSQAQRLKAVAPRRALRVATEEDGEEQARQLLELKIAAHVQGGQLALSMTDNRYTMISVKRKKGLFRLRLHHMFLEAGPDVVLALGRYVSLNDRTASQTLGRFIDINQRKIRRARPTKPQLVSLSTVGEHFDLQVLYDDLNRRYFEGRIEARITWGQRAPGGARMKRRNSIKMGSYSVEDRLIRIHPSLDRAFVPQMVVEWILFHEMLHQKHDIPLIGGRRRFHTPAFLNEEATFEHFELASRWEQQNLDLLLHY